jgi:hypothetical protein
VEVDAANADAALPAMRGLAGVLVAGSPSDGQLAALRRRAGAGSVRTVVLEERAKWPHIRANWVTRNNDVLQVAGRSAQPWIESNAALLRLRRDNVAGAPPMLTYRWTPVTVAEENEGPAVEQYLVAIAEAGSFGADLLLPLHERLQERLLLGHPDARAAWDEIRRYIAFYSANLPSRYRPVADVGVVAADSMQAFEITNLMARHNLPFRRLEPKTLDAGALERLALLVVIDAPDARVQQVLASFARTGGTVVLAGKADGAGNASDDPRSQAPSWVGGRPELATTDRLSYRLGEGRVVQVLAGIADPNAFALEIRQLLGPRRRSLDIWNGITVLAAPYEDPAGETVLVTAVNYAHQQLPVQLRVAGTFGAARWESPEQTMTLLPHRHRDGGTEFVLPALRIGARVFLTGRAREAR